MIRTKSVKEAKAKFSEIVNATEATVITNRGRTMGAFVTKAEWDVVLKHRDRQQRRDNLISTLRGCLMGQADVRKAYLFGSWARGEWREQSDIDVLIVLENVDKDTYWERYRSLKKCLRSAIRRSFDVIVDTDTEFQQSLQDPTNLEFKASKEGVLLT